MPAGKQFTELMRALHQVVQRASSERTTRCTARRQPVYTRLSFSDTSPEVETSLQNLSSPVYDTVAQCRGDLS